MKIELKSFKDFVGREGLGFSAKLYLNGKLSAYVLDDANGGEIHYDIVQNAEAKKLFEEFKAYARKEHPSTYESCSMHHAINVAIDKIYWLKDIKKYQTKSICIGKPYDAKFRYYTFPVSLTKINKINLQTEVNKIKKKLKKGEVILNTNLKKLGILV
jgi:hypothetical protein